MNHFEKETVHSPFLQVFLLCSDHRSAPRRQVLQCPEQLFFYSYGHPIPQIYKSLVVDPETVFFDGSNHLQADHQQGNV